MVNGTKGDTTYQVMLGSDAGDQVNAMLSVTVSNEETE
jgi:hypothetical protein